MGNRRGRKRKDGARYENGRLKHSVDRGTEATQLRRARLVGKRGEKTGDPDLTVWPLGVLRANFAISEDEYRAGSTYAELYSIVYRKPLPSAVALDGNGRGNGGDEMTPEEIERLEKCQAKLRRLMEAVNRVARTHGRAAKDEFDNLVLHWREPNWMRPVVPTARDVKLGQLFLITLHEVTAELIGPLKKAA